jgi:hypothetical protein
MLSRDFKIALEAYIAEMARPRGATESNSAKMDSEFFAQEKLLQAITTQEEASLAYDSLDDSDRAFGNHFSDCPDGAAYHPHESSGAAYCVLNDGSAVLVAWNDSGFWDVTFCSEEEAAREIDERNAEYSPEEEEEEEEEEE